MIESVVRNFFREILREDDIKKTVCHRLVSRILDDTLPLADSATLISFMDVFSKHLRLFCADNCASHVVQTLLCVGIVRCQVILGLVLP